MKIFLDTADSASVQPFHELGIIDGVTTNPTLILRSGKQPFDVYCELADMGIPDISMEVMGSYDEMVTEGFLLFEDFADKATIKVPCTRDGLRACKRLSDVGIKTNVTLVFSAAQAVLAAKHGATYVSPFVGRLDDQSVAGLEVVRSITSLYAMHGIRTQVLAASIRTIQRAVRSWYNGAHIVTMPPKVLEGMYDHILTDKGMEIFENDYKEYHDACQSV